MTDVARSVIGFFQESLHTGNLCFHFFEKIVVVLNM